jgi:hypothetical protein
MKKIFLAIVTFIFVNNAYTQRGPLLGSGKMINKTFDYKNFSEITLQDLDGNVIIEVGKPFSIDVAIDDNLEKLLSVSAQENNLRISLKGNRNNKLYIENTNIIIKIMVANITYIKQDGNNHLQVEGIKGESLQLKCAGNGSVVLNGSIENLKIVCSGNGNVNAAKLLAKNVAITKRGNGTVTTNTDNSFYASGLGNGDIINTGKGIAAPNTMMLGNGEIKYPSPQNIAKPISTKNNIGIKVNIKNISNSTINLSVKYPVKGSYGIAVEPTETIEESFPIGTKIYKGKRTAKKPIFIITEDSGKSLLEVE